MSHGLDNLTGLATEGIGLRFLNEEWNDSISNDHPFTIQWNESLDGAQAPELGLFKITYPKDGVIAYELVSNLTGRMNNENATCLWTPSHLDDELYTLWLSSSRDARANWTTSPPWRLKETPRHSPHWAAPIVIPIIVLLAVYTLGLTTCIVYRRRRKARREREKSKGKDLEKEKSSQMHLLGDAERHPSVDTVLTIQISLWIPSTIISEQEEFRRNTGLNYNESIRSTPHISYQFIRAKPSKPYKYRF
ncbi:hypothetical protein T069G_07903 [Trichoderma breve]|uniref:Uncharacterized protein n=1 Tax=Trichoderma breve TaxID=2034170 RepID=A0A9W9BCE7_9HYPO|nr:hypothetical protein T069G_07903 [Trichoderma breve]KAJ4857006.1 hypothetical protein T069G_07903 [Trichoderma breve]